ncbi:hypothetical protein HY489_05925 [Candidatus Woesearchaeota archaeon]|nr:hypothetical protein [Candidatus Woesearchaeota archaeon]
MELEQTVQKEAIGIPAPHVLEELDRMNDFARHTLDTILDKNYRVEEVVPKIPEGIVGSTEQPYYVIRDQKGDIVGEVHTYADKFEVTSIRKRFNAEAKNLQHVLDGYGKDVLYLPNPGCKPVLRKTPHGYELGFVQQPGIWQQVIVPIRIAPELPVKRADEALVYLLGQYQKAEPADPLYNATNLPHAAGTLKHAGTAYKGALPVSLAIAAFAHDRSRLSKNETPAEHAYEEHKNETARQSATVLRNELTGKLPDGIVGDIVFVVERHERGGDRKNGRLAVTPDSTGTYNLNEGAEVLRTADALSFFDHADTYRQHRGKEATARKIAYSTTRLGDQGRKLLGARYEPREAA